MGRTMRKDLRLSLLKQAWEFSFSHDKQIAIGVEKMYYKKYFKDEIEAIMAISTIYCTCF